MHDTLGSIDNTPQLRLVLCDGANDPSSKIRGQGQMCGIHLLLFCLGEVEIDIHEILFTLDIAAIPQVEILSKNLEFFCIFKQALPQ